VHLASFIFAQFKRHSGLPAIGDVMYFRKMFRLLCESKAYMLDMSAQAK